MQQALNNMKLPVVFSELHKWPQVKWRTLNVTCPIPIPKSHQCFLLPISLSTFSHLLDNRSLFKHKLVKQNNLNKFLKHDKPQKEIKWQVNSEIQTNLYYDPKTKHIQYVPRCYYPLPILHRDKSLCLMLLFFLCLVFFRLTIREKRGKTI